MENEFKKFVDSSWLLEIWNDGEIIFQSKKEMVGGLLDFIGQYGKSFASLTIFDTRAGNAVALLSAYLSAKEVYAVLGSQTAQETLDKFNIKHHFLKTIPNILNKAGDDICPLEKKSFSKTPEEFLNAIKIS